MVPKVSSVTFKNGLTIPIFGLGTWKSQPGEVESAVKEAITCGYRHIDCAKVYGNEKEVGNAIRAKIEDGTVKREDLFITSKLWLTCTGKELVVPSLKEQLKDLSIEYLDLYLVHWPVSLKEGSEMYPKGEPNSLALRLYDNVDTWRGMEECLRKGLAKSIGVSNFNKRQLLNILNAAEFPPVTNQIECHPYLSQKKLLEFCHSKGVTVTAYSPLGSPDRPAIGAEDPVLLENPVVKKLADKHNKSAGQILIRYHIQNGVIVIPKSVTPSRIRSNIEVFDFKLSQIEMDSLENLNKNFRYIAFKLIDKHPEYPFNDEY